MKREVAEHGEQTESKPASSSGPKENTGLSWSLFSDPFLQLISSENQMSVPNLRLHAGPDSSSFLQKKNQHAGS